MITKKKIYFTLLFALCQCLSAEKCWDDQLNPALLFQAKNLQELIQLYLKSKPRYQAENHNENLPIQYTGIFKVVKNENFQRKSFDIFHFFAQNIDCGYTLELPRRGGSNEYPQSMF